MKNKRSQVTIFIILAIVLVVAIAVFFLYRAGIVGKAVPADMQPIYNDFLSCLEEDVLTGVNVLESQAGYVVLPDFEPGSAYMPFSSQLNFLGNPIPYWYYVSGNNIQKEQVPLKGDMEEELGNFIDSQIRGCALEKYYEEGYGIIEGEPSTKVIIGENNIKIVLDMDLSIEKEEEHALVSEHEINVKTKLGSLYDAAKTIYEKEQKELFLENYAVDTLRLYAPVDGVEITCSPKIWNADEVFSELRGAIEANTLSLKMQGGDYTLNSKEDKYFVVDLNVGKDVRFLNSKNWSYGLEVIPSEENLLLATPVGNQQGLGILGFCYVPYHFVYNVEYPVLIQVYDGEEIFQFPVAVVIQGNKPREALVGEGVEMEDSEFCNYKNTSIKMNTYDSELNRIGANISYECFGSVCSIGQTSASSALDEKFPQCINGYIVAEAEGFGDTRYLYSVVNEDTVSIVMKKLYDLNVGLNLDNIKYSGDAIITFVSDSASKTIIYPQQKEVALSEGEYEIQVYIYKNSSLTFEATSKEQCIQTPQTGFGGLFGLTHEECFEMEIPEQIISNVLAGGGKETSYLSEYELANSDSLEINAESLEVPDSLEQLQENYALFEAKGFEINLI